MEKYNNHLAVLVLAAGTSSRLKRPKQLERFNNDTLLSIAVKNALNISENVFVVLGHEKNRCEDEIRNLDVNIIYNKNFSDGIGSSISLGISKLKDKFDGVMILLCDQPFMPVEHLLSLKSHFVDYPQIVASIYSGNSNPTVPAIFPKSYFDRLTELDGDIGAKKILKNEEVLSLPLSNNYSVDIDTQVDVNRYLK